MSDKYKSPVLTDNRNMRKDVREVDAYFAAVNSELSALPKVDNLVVSPEFVEFISCPVCGESRSRQAFVKQGFLYALCSGCSHLFVKNRLKENVLLGLYADSKADQIARKVSMSSAHLEYWGLVHRKYLQYVSERPSSNGNLIDIGCGAGTFLANARSSTKMNLHGLDFCKDTYEDILELIPEQNYYFQERLEDIDFKGKRFGLITLWGVLEHLVDPKSVLNKSAQLLADDGLIILLFPNPNSRAIKILGVNTPTLNPRAHINMYSRESFELLCKSAGLSIVSRYQELPVIDLMYPFVHYTEEYIQDLVDNFECYYDVYIVQKEKM